MSAGTNAADGRLGLMLSELRLPTIKRIAGDLCAQSDREGWPGRPRVKTIGTRICITSFETTVTWNCDMSGSRCQVPW